VFLFIVGFFILSFLLLFRRGVGVVIIGSVGGGVGGIFFLVGGPTPSCLILGIPHICCCCAIVVGWR